MRISDSEIDVTKASKFHNFLLVEGSVSSEKAVVVAANLRSSDYEITQQSYVRFASAAGAANRSQFNFEVQALLNEPFDFVKDLRLTLTFEDGDVQDFSLAELSVTKSESMATKGIYRDFCDQIRAHPGAKVLDLGGRDRSRVDRSQGFPDVDFTVVDIVESENVDVVGDAHELSRYFAKDTFDYMISLSVFEHLAMPWKVAIEMNKVMKMGGLALIQAPQSIGMHDLPWDFWRFSDAAWSPIFNEQTGFRIVAKFRDFPNYVIPFLIREDQLDAEEAAGFEISMVIVEKVGKAKEKWQTQLASVVEGNYPVE